MASPRSVLSNLPLVLVDLFQEGKAGKRSPGVDIPYQTGQTEGLAEVGLESELDGEECDVGERGFEGWCSRTEGDVPWLDYWESSLGVSKCSRGCMREDLPKRPWRH
jgi:hypothetical protein